ncbi:MAG: NUDIX domain-containing protein [Endomicrobium sp.]|nr:NUDIX domain-containing protein [Endomicrobium sp.]
MGFPKGHVENGETEIATVRREILEEAGIKNLKFIINFRHGNVYIMKGVAIAFEEPSSFDKMKYLKIE